MSSNKDGSNTYPSIDGSDVYRSSSFWSLPTLVSSPAWSCQSMVTNVSSQPDKMSYEILFDYPAQARGYQILEVLTEWFDEASINAHLLNTTAITSSVDILQLLTHSFLLWQTLHSKLLAVEEVWRKMEEMTAKLIDSMVETQAAKVCMHTALEHVTAVMQIQHLLLDIVEYPKADGRVKWTLFLYGDAVFQGEAENKSEVLCASFFEKLRRSLEKPTANRRCPSS